MQNFNNNLKVCASTIIKVLLGFYYLFYLIFRFYFAKQFYYILIQSSILLLVLILNISQYGLKFNWIQDICLFFVIITVYYLVSAIFLQRKIKKRYDLVGFKRWDRTWEIHIADNIKNAKEFQVKLINIIEYCKKENLKIEFISGYRSYGKLIKTFGNAILLIKPLSAFEQVFIGAIIRPYEKDRSMSSDFLHLVVLNPHEIKIKSGKNGKKFISY